MRKKDNFRTVLMTELNRKEIILDPKLMRTNIGYRTNRKPLLCIRDITPKLINLINYVKD